MQQAKVQPAIIEPVLLKVEEAADLIKVGRTKMYALVAAGDVPSVRLGRAVRVPLNALRRWADEQAADVRG